MLGGMQFHLCPLDEADSSWRLLVLIIYFIILFLYKEK